MNLAAIFKGIGYLIQSFLAPTPQQIALKNFAGEAWPFLQYCAAYPRMKQLEASGQAVAVAFDGSVTLSPEGHVTTLEPPVTLEPGGRPSGSNRGGLMPPGT